MKQVIQVVKGQEPALRLLLVLTIFLAGWLFISDMGHKSQVSEYMEKAEKHQKAAERAILKADSLEQINQYLNRISAEASQRAAALEAQAKRQQAINAERKKKIDSLTAALDSTSTPSDSITTLVEIVEEQKDVISSQDTTINTQRKQIAEMKIAQTADSIVKANQAATIDSLKVVIEKTPYLEQDPDKLFGIIPMPSRKTSFITGAVVGAITILLLVP